MGDIVKFKPKAPAIKIELVETHVFMRWSCTVCGGCTDRVAILAEGEQALSNNGDSRTVRVCEECLRAGEIDARLEQTACQMEAEAALLRKMIGRIQVPTFAEWQARCKQSGYGWIDDDEIPF